MWAKPARRAHDDKRPSCCGGPAVSPSARSECTAALRKRADHGGRRCGKARRGCGRCGRGRRGRRRGGRAHARAKASASPSQILQYAIQINVTRRRVKTQRKTCKKHTEQQAKITGTLAVCVVTNLFIGHTSRVNLCQFMKCSALDIARCLPVPNFEGFFVVESRTVSYTCTRPSATQPRRDGRS